MHGGFHHNPALTVALAMAAGVIAQSLARYLRIPGIVLLLAAGVILGPDLANVVQPEALGHGLEVLIGFAVAVILFDGGLNLHLGRMRKQAPAIRRLLTVGVFVTTVGGALAARFWLGWGWTPSLLFGTLVIVTGPTVVTPLLRRIRVRRSVETILESEGVLIDAVGAVVAVVALEIVLGTSLASGALSAPVRLLAGLAIGGMGGGVMGLLLRWRLVVPVGFETIFTLSFTLAVYQISNAVAPESGIMAAIVAGAVVGNSHARGEREIREFKEQLTTLLIGMLFVLLAADVRVVEVVALGRPGLLVVLTLMFVVRPINILLCTFGTGLDWREKSFLSWVAPRGIVAAAVASLFAERLDSAGGNVGGQLRALVFLVIAATVIAQGATAGMVARLLKVCRPSAKGFAILGANSLGRLLGNLLQERGHEVVLLDSNADMCSEAEAEGLKVLFGNAMNETVQLRAQMDTRRAAIGLTHNEAVNLLFAKKASEESKVRKVYSAGDHHQGGVTPDHLKEAGVRLLFGNETDTELWAVRTRRKQVQTETWRRNDDTAGQEPTLPRAVRTLVLPLFTVGKNGDLAPVDCSTSFAREQTVIWLLVSEREKDARAWLAGQGWRAVEEAEAPESLPDDPA
ncbi:MAG: cation:proton antiporter [Gemmatimonadales bacterium]|nr:cation:proton antiporter [Gemmatimonadales bacterium]